MKLATIALSFLVLAGVSAARADDATQENFNKKCATCHGKDGSGKTTMGLKLKARDLGDPAVQDKLTDAQIQTQIENGAKDKETGKERMPAFKDKLKPDEIQTMIKYVRTLKRK